MSDFNFSAHEFATYFDASIDNPYNKALVEAKPRVGLQRMAAEAPGDKSLKVTTQAQRGRRVAREIPEPNLAGTPAPPPAINSGWDAEQYVASALDADGWDVHDVSRQRLGYDLLIKRGRQTRYVDVKSSVGLCSPNLTAREWQQASAHREKYILAVVENFNPTGENRIHWVPDPVRCPARESQQTIYAVARSSWRQVEVDLSDI